MNRIQDYSKLQFDIDKWIKDYYYMHGIQSLVVGVSGGIDSAVVSTLCAKTGLPTYVVAMPLNSTHQNTRLSDLHTKQLAEKYEIFKKVSTRFELPDGSKQFGKTILNDPEKYFTEDIMHQLDIAAETEFKYG